MYATKDPLCNISGGWELYLTSHRVRKADKASIHYLQSITTYYHGILLHFWVLQQFDEADETIKKNCTFKILSELIPDQNFLLFLGLITLCCFVTD